MISKHWNSCRENLSCIYIVNQQQFWMKECDILGRSKHTLTPYTYFQCRSRPNQSPGSPSLVVWPRISLLTTVVIHNRQLSVQHRKRELRHQHELGSVYTEQSRISHWTHVNSPGVSHAFCTLSDCAIQSCPKPRAVRSAYMNEVKLCKYASQRVLYGRAGEVTVR